MGSQCQVCASPLAPGTTKCPTCGSMQYAASSLSPPAPQPTPPASAPVPVGQPPQAIAAGGASPAFGGQMAYGAQPVVAGSYATNAAVAGANLMYTDPVLRQAKEKADLSLILFFCGVFGIFVLGPLAWICLPIGWYIGKEAVMLSGGQIGVGAKQANQIATIIAIVLFLIIIGLFILFIMVVLAAS